MATTGDAVCAPGPVAVSGPHDRPLTAVEAALLRLLDTAAAIEAGEVPEHLTTPPPTPFVVPHATGGEVYERPDWTSRVRHVLAVWGIVAAVGVTAFDLAPGPARPHVLPSAPQPVVSWVAGHPLSAR